MKDDFWFLLDQGPLDGSVNMAVDEFLLNRHDSRPVLRFYQWNKATLSLGISQNVDRHVNSSIADQRGILVVRRLTGGKAVLHDSEITYSVTGSLDRSPFDCDLLDSYREIAKAFCTAFSVLGIDAEMATRETRAARGSITSCFASPSAYEIVVGGKKLLGSAQKRTRSRVLQHGSLLVDYRETDWQTLMKRRSSVSTDRVVDLRTLLTDRLSIVGVKAALVRGFSEYFGVKLIPLELSETNWAEIHDIAQKNYANVTSQLDSEQA